MKSRFVRIGVIIASVTGLMLSMTPAEATWVKTITFTGPAVLANCAGMVFPGVNGVVPDATTTIKPDPKGFPEVNTTVRNGNTCDVALSSSACIKLSVGKKTGVDLCSMVVSGTVTGFCGLSSGRGTLVVRNLSGLKADVVTDFKWSEALTIMRISGGNATQNVTGAVSVLPITGSCTNKTATGFMWSGSLTIKHIN